MSGGVEVKNVSSFRSLSSRWLAVSCAALYLVVSAVIGAALLATPQPEAGVRPTMPTYVADKDASDATTTVTAPNGFRRVTGPQLVQTVIPTGWQVARGGAPGAMRATDPSDSGRFIGYGGAPAAKGDMADVHVRSETTLAARTARYERVGLTRATYAGHPAVEWEYHHDDGSGQQHVRALFWRVDGIEYFIFASSPETRWQRMLPIYDEMVANSRP